MSRYNFKPNELVGHYYIEHESLIQCLADYSLNVSRVRMYKRLVVFMPVNILVLKENTINSSLIQELVMGSVHIE